MTSSPMCWPLARLANEACVVGPVWRYASVRGAGRWIADRCRTHIGPLASAGGCWCNLRVMETRVSCWTGAAFVWPTAVMQWVDAMRTVVTVRPSSAEHASWRTAQAAKAAMEDLLYGRPAADGLHVWTGQPGRRYDIYEDVGPARGEGS